MRVAVALPSLDPAAPERRSIDAMLVALAAAGHDVEGFAEHDRSDESADFPVYHYLRLPERHAAQRFRTALYPLGRDGTPYQSVYGLMQLFPGVVWFLDPIVHHLALGGIGLMEDWAGYRRLLDAAYGEHGAAVAQTVATNWGTGALFRRYDLVAATAADQPVVLAAWPALAEKIQSRLTEREVGVVPLGILPGETGARVGDNEPADAAPSGGTRVAIMSVNDSYATTAVRAAACALELDGVSVQICLSEPIHKAEGRGAAEHLGIYDAIDWQLTTAPADLAATAAAADVAVWLAEELQGGHRLLMLQTMASGKPTFVPDSRLYADLPDGAVAKMSLGRGLGPTFGGLLGAMLEDSSLRRGLAEEGRRFAAGCAGIDDAARQLAEALERAPEAVGPGPVSAVAWRALAGRMGEAALPGGAGDGVEAMVGEIIQGHVRSPAE